MYILGRKMGKTEAISGVYEDGMLGS